ncbi:MAG: selenide, water dikinase SelD [Anaerolineales bacterium]|nr:selenide, water dikinase SelD [Anaerolineales bacterium]
MNAETLAQVLRPIQGLFDPRSYPDLLVGLGDPDDAAVWKLDDERALVVTTDFFTPVVDDPYEYGKIAAANSLSDVYAMGGQPFLALNVAALPPDLPPEVNGAILRGGADKCKEAGVVLAGGHTIQDKEPKYGLVVLGFAHPAKMLTKGGARPGDALVLTKPLGFGVTTTALKQEKAAPQDLAEVIDWMGRLNREAAALAVEFGLRAGTDVTGFSLLGHAMEMAEASQVGLRLVMEKIPFVSGAQKYAGMWTFPGGAADNSLYFGPRVRFAAGISEEQRMLLFDPQTSGGLLLAVPGPQRKAFLRRADKTGQPAWVIGEVVAGKGIEVV